MANLIKSGIFIIFFVGAVYVAQGQDTEPTKVIFVPKGDTTQVLSYPLNVMSIIDSKCLGCHQPGARSEKAREALQWEQLQSMDILELVAILDEVIEVLDEGTMPPEKMVQKYPNLKLTDEEINTLKDWAVASTKAAVGE